MNTPTKVRLLIVDDHQMLIDGIKALLKNEKQFEVVGECTKSPEAIKMVEELKPDVLLTDINMPDMSGIELTRLLKPNHPDLKVLVLSMFNEKGMITEMLNAGVSGYILKNTGRQELIDALNKIVSGGMYFSDEVAVEMMKSIANPVPPKAASEAILTTREKEIVQLIAKEYNNAKIADTLFISERTVETHRKNILRKTGTHSVLGLVKFAMEHGIVEK